MKKVKIVNKSNNELPNYSTENAAGMDLRAFIPEDVTLAPFERKMVPTGIHIQLPVGYEAQIRPRSGLALKNGVTVLNTPGTIDSDYTGQICIILINLSQEPFVIKSGERIAQMVIAKHKTVKKWKLVEELEETKRGDGGFGHTGKK
jgi:dUTP pyrophosphatase